MSLPTAIELVPGTHVWFAPRGTALSIAGSAIRYGGATANVVQVDVKPILNSTQADTAWVKFGDVITSSHKIDKGQPIKVRGPAPAKLKVKKIIYPTQEQMVEFTTEQVDRRALQLAFGSLSIGASDTQFNPDEGTPDVEGWLRVQIMNYDNTTPLTLDLWVSLTLVDGLTFDPEKLTEPKYSAQLLYSPLNTAAI